MKVRRVALGAAVAVPVAIAAYFLSSTPQHHEKPTTFKTLDPNPFGEPVPKGIQLHLIVRKRIGYVTALEEEWKIPAWVAYGILRQYFDEGAPTYPRLSRFLADTSLPEACRVTHDHYTGSPFDRGHMAPHASMQGRNQACVQESYLMSNIAPQTKKLNETIWKNLEDKERQWARKYGELWVVTGPVFQGGVPTEWLVPKDPKLTEKIAVATHFFKIFLRREGNRYHALAFVIPNQMEGFADPLNFASWQESVDQVEDSTHLDFFSSLDDAVEDEMEKAREPIWN